MRKEERDKNKVYSNMFLKRSAAEEYEKQKKRKLVMNIRRAYLGMIPRKLNPLPDYLAEYVPDEYFGLHITAFQVGKTNYDVLIYKADSFMKLLDAKTPSELVWKEVVAHLIGDKTVYGISASDTAPKDQRPKGIVKRIKQALEEESDFDIYQILESTAKRETRRKIIKGLIEERTKRIISFLSDGGEILCDTKYPSEDRMSLPLLVGNKYGIKEEKNDPELGYYHFIKNVYMLGFLDNNGRIDTLVLDEFGKLGMHPRTEIKIPD